MSLPAHRPRTSFPVSACQLFSPSRRFYAAGGSVSADRSIKHQTSNLKHQPAAFTLVELLAVITIIIIFVAFLFPAFRGVQDQAKKAQAKNDLQQIVTAVNAFYTEYGRYPLSPTTDTTFGPGGTPATNETLFNTLRGLNLADNARQIVFISPPSVKDKSNPRSGIGTDAANIGQYFDPWGKNYLVRIDGTYDNQIPNPYGGSGGAGTDPVRQGVIAWSLGIDGKLGTNGDNIYRSAGGAQSDDVISWQ